MLKMASLYLYFAAFLLFFSCTHETTEGEKSSEFSGRQTGERQNELKLETSIDVDQKVNKDSDFENFISKIPRKKIPVNLDMEYMSEGVLVNNAEEIPVKFVLNYLFPTEKQSRLKALVEVYSFFPLFTLISPAEGGVSTILFIFLKRGSAGGIEDRFNLLVYRKEDGYKRCFEIAHIFGDCSFTDILEASIRSHEFIAQNRYKVKGDCNDDSTLKDTTWIKVQDSLRIISSH